MTAGKSSDSTTTNESSDPVARPQGTITALREELRRVERFGPVELQERCNAFADIELREAELLAWTEDGRSTTLSVGVLLTRLSGWQRLCARHGLDSAVEACEDEATFNLAEAAAEWSVEVGAAAPEANAAMVFRDLTAAGQLLQDVRNRDFEAEAAAIPIREAQQTLQRSLLEKLKDTPPDDIQLAEWSRLVSDHCISVLTVLDDLSPERATTQIKSTIEETNWYLEHVDARRKVATAGIRRKVRRLQAELQERQLQSKMESRFGRRFVGAFERTILVLICLVLFLMGIEWTITLNERTQFWFNVVDACACFVFLTEFFTKLSLVQGRGRWFMRHLFVDLIPSIPVGLLTAGLANSGDVIRAGRAARFARLPRLARYVRILRPVIRLSRALGLMARGIDRLVRQYSHVLNVNVILHPNQEEHDRYAREARRSESELQNLSRPLLEVWTGLLAEASPAERDIIAERRVAVLTELRESKSVRFEEGAHLSVGARDIPAEALLDRMESLEPTLVEPVLGEPMMQQLARIIRTMSIIPIRWLPIIRSCIPHPTTGKSEAELVAEASQKSAAFFRRFHDAWFWLSDLYGTLTPSQFIDRLGGILVKGSFRPAQRLVLFGGIFLLVEALLLIITLTSSRQAVEAPAESAVAAVQMDDAQTASDADEAAPGKDAHPLVHVRHFLRRFVGTTVLVLGAICFVILAFGWWLQRVAREATEFYEKSVLAQFLLLTESIRPRKLTRDARTLYDRVLRPDWPEDDDRSEEQCVQELELRLRNSLVHTESEGAEARRFPFVDRLVLLYRDWLDGAMFTTSDTRATNQLLGNTALRQLLLTSERISKKQIKELNQIDLEHQKSLFKGPYLWFQFIGQSISHSVASLLVEYNRKAVPLHELDHSREETRSAYSSWLGTVTAEYDPSAKPVEEEARYVTTAFTALHFLDPDSNREGEIEERFGPVVIERLRRDRSLLIRRTFGTLPMHRRPRSERVVNLFGIYESWISGGRMFLVPLFVLGAVLKGLKLVIVWLAQAVGELRHPERRSVQIDAAQADFRVAARKIGRICGPAAATAARLRAILDPAWLGTPLPGESGTRLHGADYEVDMEFLRLGPALEREIEAEHRRSQENMRNLEHAVADGLLNRIAEHRGLESDALSSRQHLRAAGIAVHADLRRVRSCLFGRSILDDCYRATSATPSWRDRFSLRFGLRSRFAKFWNAHGSSDKRARRIAFKATLQNENGVASALQAWAEFGDDLQQEGERRLGEILVHPGRLTEQLMTLRTIQTLTVLDVLHYREHVLKLGEYGTKSEEELRLVQLVSTGE